MENVIVNRLEDDNKVAKTTLAIFVLSYVYGLYSQYFFLCILSGLVLIAMIKLLWQPYIPAVLLYFFLFQWVQIATAIIYADFVRERMEILFSNSSPQLLMVVTLLQLLSMCIIANLISSSGKIKVTYNFLKEQIDKINVRRVLIAFLISSVIFPGLEYLTRAYGSINQLVSSAAFIRSMLLIILIFVIFTRRTPYNAIIIGLLLLEFILGFASYFSDFKSVIFYILIVYLTIRPKIRLSSVLMIAPLVLFLGYVMIFWSYVKPDYRAYVNKNDNQQQVNVSKGEALSYLEDRAAQF
ncbi:MAG TPA: hypothetical protein VHA52_03245, partial [Candidatus Babeliaceae bacterium]|nr:hypothetical protein [Candidatus Babeliaceae bacterium]